MSSNHLDSEQRLALFIDFENIAIGVRDAHYRKFDINLVLERLLEKGKILVKRAYADWSRYSDYKRSFHEAAIELIEVPQKSLGGKNSADIRLVVDAMDISFQKEHLNAFVVASGDSDFSPLVSKLKENNKYVIGVGVKNSTSDLLLDNCDEFIFYEDLVRGQQRPLAAIAGAPEKIQECFGLLVDSVLALQRENKEILWGSMVKETMKRKRPSFNETYYGFRTFSHLLEDAQRRGIVVLRRDQRSGSYVIDDLAAIPSTASPRPAVATEASRAASDATRAEARPEAAKAEAARPEGEGSETAGDATDVVPEGSASGRPRRRRGGRGRRTRSGSASGGAGSSQTNGEGVDEGGDDGDNGGGDEVTDTQAAPADAPDATDSGHRRPRRRSSPRDSESAAGAAAEAPASSSQEPSVERPPADSKGEPAGPAPEVVRPPGGFGLFSWLRREPAREEGPAAAATPSEPQPRKDEPES